MYDIFLSLGSNIEPREIYLKKAMIFLNKEFNFIKISSLYLTSPVDDENQDHFYNLCVHYKTEIENPYEILKITQSIENRIGRNKDKNRLKGPRNIDIDILLFSDVEVDSDILCIPHKSMFDRNFVLIPLLEILENYPISNKNYDLQGFIKKNNSQEIKKIGELKIE